MTGHEVWLKRCELAKTLTPLKACLEIAEAERTATLFAKNVPSSFIAVADIL